MIDLTKKALPNTITVDGKAYSIYTDFRVWLRFMNDLEEHKGLFDVRYIFKNEMPPKSTIRELMQFASPPKELPRILERDDEILLDFRIDADLIFSAFMGQYGIDLLEVDLHWHKFLALLNGLNSSTKLREVMGYRCYEKNNDKNHDVYEDLKYAWSIERMSEEEQASLDAFNEAFTCGEGEN